MDGVLPSFAIFKLIIVSTVSHHFKRKNVISSYLLIFNKTFFAKLVNQSLAVALKRNERKVPILISIE